VVEWNKRQGAVGQRQTSEGSLGTTVRLLLVPSIQPGPLGGGKVPARYKVLIIL